MYKNLTKFLPNRFACLATILSPLNKDFYLNKYFHSSCLPTHTLQDNPPTCPFNHLISTSLSLLLPKIPHQQRRRQHFNEVQIENEVKLIYRTNFTHRHRERAPSSSTTGESFAHAPVVIIAAHEKPSACRGVKHSSNPILSIFFPSLETVHTGLNQGLLRRAEEG